MLYIINIERYMSDCIVLSEGLVEGDYGVAPQFQ